MKKLRIIIALLLTLTSMSSLPAMAGPAERGPNCSRPYGGYCRGPRWGWYGAKQPVTTQEEARKHLEKYFADGKVTIGSITERSSYFEAEIKDKDNKVVDRVIIDKRSGRIRSIY